ncbi:hypothetical protein BDZ45DRAFT_747516 [Acephala macrosclerotiorum]|nr:hypothetical protein BDZ45DRAFT_747516 [Acephala macrosclerotiorum]
MAQLPNELWLKVLPFLPPADLPKVARASKHFNALAEPLIYSEVDLVKNTKGSTAALECFLRAIVKKPERGSFVKRAVLSVAYNEQGGIVNRTLRTMFNTPSVPLTPVDNSFLDGIDVAGLLRQVIEDTGALSFCVDQYTSITKERNWDSLLGFLLLMISRNLQHLTLHRYDEAECSKINAVVRFLIEKQPTSSGANTPFAKLNKVALLPDPANTDPQILIYRTLYFSRLEPYMLIRQPSMPFIGLPSVADFVGTRITCSYIDKCGGSIAASMPNIKSIELRACDFTPTNLRRFLERFPNLERIKWTTSKLDHINAQPLSTIRWVGHLKSTLKEIIIDDNLGLLDPGMANLTEFTALKTLQIDSFTALGKPRRVPFSAPQEPLYYPEDIVDRFITFLPASLEYLKVTASPELKALLAQISKILGAQHLSNLKQLTLTGECRRGSIWELTGAKDGLKLAEEKGVKLELLDSYIVLIAWRDCTNGSERLGKGSGFSVEGVLNGTGPERWCQHSPMGSHKYVFKVLEIWGLQRKLAWERAAPEQKVYAVITAKVAAMIPLTSCNE